MEAANPKRAAVRLAATGGGLVLTVGLLAVTAHLAATRDAEPVAEKPAWDVIETGASYRLPTADDAITPVRSRPEEAPAYEPPAYVEPRRDAPAPAPAAASPGQGVAPPAAWSGPMTIHNPAALGPPEDGSLPPIPSAAPPRLAGAPGETPGLAAPAPPGHPRLPDPAAHAAAPALNEPPLTPEDLPAGEPRRAASAAELRDLGDADQNELLGYTLSTNELSKRLEPEVQAGFQLGKSGAVYAARAKFVSVLRRIAMAKDAQQGATRHATALAEGLRTLDDADDFVPKGDALEAELDVPAIARSHGLRLAGADTAPHEAIARYSRHAAERLAEAAAGEPAGSMALYGLGKTYLRLEAQGDDPTAGRKSTVMFHAAVDANPENYLAANELGVRLARTGRYEQASRVLRRAAQQPGAIAAVHANLAAIEERLGRDRVAALAQQQSERLAQRERAAGEVSRRHGVQWVAPETLRGAGPRRPPAGQAPPPTAAAYAPPRGTPPAEPAAGGWKSLVRTAKRITGWSSPTPPPTVQPTPGRPPVVAPPQRVLR